MESHIALAFKEFPVFWVGSQRARVVQRKKYQLVSLECQGELLRGGGAYTEMYRLHKSLSNIKLIKREGLLQITAPRKTQYPGVRSSRNHKEPLI